MVMENRALSASTSMRCVLRSSVGSAQMASRVRSGPMPASASAAATLTLSGKPRAPSRALPSKTLSGRREALERDAACHQIGRAGEPARRLARRHGDAVDLAFRRGAARVEPEQRASRDDDAGAAGARPLDQVDMLEQRAGAQWHEDAPAGDGGLGNGAELRRRQALDDDVGPLGEPGQRHDGRGYAGGGEPPLRPGRIARRDGGQPESGHALGKPPRHREADGAQPADGNRKDVVRN